MLDMRPPINGSSSRSASFSAGAILLAEFVQRAADDYETASAEVTRASRLSAPHAIQDHLATVAGRLLALASIQRLLLPPREVTFDLGDRLCELCHYHAEARFAALGSFIRLKTCEAQVDAERGWALLIIVSELLSNAARHAFKGPGGMVHIEVMRGNHATLCQVSDNGVGLEPGVVGRKNGTMIAKELARSAGIDFVSLPRPVGTGYELRLSDAA